MTSVVNVLEPADSYDLISLDELKTLLGVTGTTEDARLGLIISSFSGQVADATNRIFGYEKVKEDFYNLDGSKHLLLSRWPVNLVDIESFTYNGTDMLPLDTWTLEPETGIIYMPAGWWSGDVSITYSGGYHLPDGAPPALKQASFLIGKDQFYSAQRGDASIRMISHKGSRVMYFSPEQIAGGSKSTGSSGNSKAIENLLSRYIRRYV